LGPAAAALPALPSALLLAVHSCDPSSSRRSVVVLQATPLLLLLLLAELVFDRKPSA
jgi:hypothetical protein